MPQRETDTVSSVVGEVSTWDSAQERARQGNTLASALHQLDQSVVGVVGRFRFGHALDSSSVVPTASTNSKRVSWNGYFGFSPWFKSSASKRESLHGSKNLLSPLHAWTRSPGSNGRKSSTFHIRQLQPPFWLCIQMFETPPTPEVPAFGYWGMTLNAMTARKVVCHEPCGTACMADPQQHAAMLWGCGHRF